MTDSFKDRLNKAITMRGIKPIELADITGISKSRISQYMKGIYTPKSKATYAIAKALKVREAWLMGFDVPMENDIAEEQQPLVNDDPELTEYLEELRNRPELRMMFSLTSKATKAEVEKAVKIVEALLEDK